MPEESDGKASENPEKADIPEESDGKTSGDVEKSGHAGDENDATGN